MKFSIVFPLRGRPIAMLARTLAAIRWQNPDHEVEVIVVSNGNTQIYDERLRAFADANDVKVIQIDTGVWNKSKTSNVGLRAASPESQYLATMDIDILLAPTFFDAISAVPNLGKRFVLCQVGELPDDIEYPETLTPAAYDRLSIQAKWPAPTHGIGGIQFAPRKFWFDVHGYDEDMIYWGSMDSDMADRAVRYGLTKTWINRDTTMLHQPHIKKGRILPTDEMKAAATKAHADNRRMRHARKNILVRNKYGWGEG